MKRIVSFILITMLLLGSVLALASCDLFEARDLDALSGQGSGEGDSGLIEDAE